MNLLAITSGNSNFTTLYFLVLIGIMVVMTIVTSTKQKKQNKKREEELSSLKAGDEIVTIGGFYANVVQYHEEDKTFTIKLKPDGTKALVKREAIAYKVSHEE